MSQCSGFGLSLFAAAALGCVALPQRAAAVALNPAALIPSAFLPAPLAQATLTRSAEQIPELSFDSNQFDLEVEELADDQYRLHFKLSGFFRRSESSLLFGQTKVEVDPKTKKFEVDVTVEQPKMPLDFTAVDGDGKVVVESIALESTPEDPIERAIQAQTDKVYFYDVGANISSMSYEDNAEGKLSQIAMGFKATASHFIDKNRKQQLSGNLFATVMTPYTSVSGLSLGLLGANLRYGYQILDAPGWRLWLHGGYFFLTTSSPNDRIGFSGLLAPQIYPSISMPLPGKRVLNAYVKLAPFYGLDFESREIAAGVSISQRQLTGRSHGLSLDYSNVAIEAAPAFIHLTSIVVGYSYGF